MRRSFLWVTLSVATIGCGGAVDVGGGGAGGTRANSTSNDTSTANNTNSTAGTGGASTSNTNSATNGTTGSGGSMYLNCPQTLPNGGSCAMDGLECSYGDEIAPACRSVVVCKGGTWSAKPGNFCNPALCPAEMPAAKTPCNTLGTQCGYPDGTICDCNQCEGGGFCNPMPTQWFCDPPQSKAGCPPIAPNEGVVCGTPDLSCFYPPSCISPEVACKDGAWVWESIACGG